MAWSNPGISLKGTRGAQILFGARDPVAGDGFDGDGWINTQTGRLFAQKTSGAWPTTYASLIGPSGASVRVGTGSPSSTNPATQADGDVFVQTDATGGPALWGPRSGGSWPSSSTSLAGAAGASFLSGNGPPSNSLGTSATPGFFDYTNFVIYGPKKADGTWPTGSSLVGPKGSQFYTDTAAPGLQLGTVSDFFFRSDTYDFFIKVTNAAVATTAQYPNGWLVMANLRGAAGAAGTNAVSPPGLYSGSGAPGTVSGAQVGSYYIRTDTTQLYGPLASNGTWGGPVNLIGSLPANITGQSILITLPSSGAAQYPYWLKGPTGTSLFNVDNVGNIAGGNIYGQGTLQMIGAATMAGVSATTLSASGAVTMSTTLAVTGAATLSSTLSVSGNATLNSALTVTGATSAANVTSSGTITAKNFALTSGGGGTFTFADGTTQSTAAAGGGGGGSGYRDSMKGSYWSGSGAPTAGAWYALSELIQTPDSSGVYNVALTERMYAAGYLTAFAANSASQGAGGGVSSLSFRILKNGTVIQTFNNFYSTSKTAVTGATQTLGTSLTFAANDLLTIQVAAGTANNSTHCSGKLAFTYTS